MDKEQIVKTHIENEAVLFRKYKGLFISSKQLLLDLDNPLIQFLARQRGIYPNDDVFGTLSLLDGLLHGNYKYKER